MNGCLHIWREVQPVTSQERRHTGEFVCAHGCGQKRMPTIYEGYLDKNKRLALASSARKGAFKRKKDGWNEN